MALSQKEIEEVLVVAPAITAQVTAQTSQAEAAEELATEIAGKQQAVVPGVPKIVMPTVNAPDTPASNASNALSEQLPPDVSAALARNQELSATISGTLQTNMDVGNQQANAMANAIVERTAAEQVIALQADTAALKAQQETIKVFEASGGYDAQVDRAKDAREFEVKLEELTTKRADIMDDEHVGNSIIDGVINSFRAYGTEVAIEQTAMNAQQNAQDINNTTAMVQSAAQTNLTVAKTVSEGTVAANQKKLAASGQVELYKAKLVQNRANAENLKTLLSVGDQEMNSIMKGYDLLNSVENRAMQRERLNLDRQVHELRVTQAEVTARRALIGEQREALALEYEGQTLPARVQTQMNALDQQEVALKRQVIALTVDAATFQGDIEASASANEQAKVNLEATQLRLDQEKDPAKKAAIQAEWDRARVQAEEAEFRFQELKDTQDTRVARGEGALAAQETNNKILARQDKIASLLEANKTAEAMALMQEGERERTAAAEVRVANTEAVQNFQSFIYGEHAVEPGSVINDRLDSNDPRYQMMRLQGSLTGPNNEFILGTTPSKAKANLAVFEQGGVVSSEIKGVRILREVDAILAKEHAEGTLPMPADQVGIDMQYNQRVEKYIQDKGSDIIFNDVTNPLAPPTIPQAAALSSTYAAQPLTQVLVANGQEDANVDQMLEQGLAQVTAGNMTQDQLIAGIVSFGNVTAINNNVNTHGTATIGLPYQAQVNMRVMRPRGFTSSVLDTIQSNLQGAIVPAAVGLTAAGAVLAAPVTAGASLAVGKVGIGAMLGATAAGGAAASLTSSFLAGSADYTTLNIADPVAVRQHLISILSSTSLGGESTPANMQGE